MNEAIDAAIRDGAVRALRKRATRQAAIARAGVVVTEAGVEIRTGESAIAGRIAEALSGVADEIELGPTPRLPVQSPTMSDWLFCGRLCRMRRLGGRSRRSGVNCSRASRPAGAKWTMLGLDIGKQGRGRPDRGKRRVPRGPRHADVRPRPQRPPRPQRSIARRNCRQGGRRRRPTSNLWVHGPQTALYRPKPSAGERGRRREGFLAASGLPVPS